jgi:hypothetical protein
MLAIVLALVSALAYGVSDYAAGLASRDFSVIQVTLVSAAASTLVVVAVLPFALGHLPGVAPLAWGALAGLGEEVGALALYYGFRHGLIAGICRKIGAWRKVRRRFWPFSAPFLPLSTNLPQHPPLASH